MKNLDRLSVQKIYKRFLAFGMAAVLAICAMAILPPVLSGAASAKNSVPSILDQQKADIQGDTYVNSAQGYSVQYQDHIFGIEETNKGAGQTAFYLKDSKLGTSKSHGSKFTVNYAADWDGNPDINQYFEGVLFNAQMADPDSFVQMTASPYEFLEAGGVEFPTVAWTRTDAKTGQYVLEIRIMGVIEGGGCAFFGASMVEDEVQTVADALGRAVGSFRIDPDTSGGKRVAWVNATSLAAQSSQTQASISYTAVEKTDGYSYILRVPKEWTGFTEFGGYGESSLLEAYDYSNPAVRMTFWGWQEIPGSDLAAQMSGVPFVMPNGTVADFVGLLPTLSYYAVQNGQLSMPDETRILSVDILDVFPASAVIGTLAQIGMDQMITDEAFVLARVILDDGKDTEVIALFYGTVAATGLGDFLSYSVMNVYGVFAPENMFAEVATALAESGCGQFGLYDSYMQGRGIEFDASIYENSYQQWQDFILSTW